MWNSNGESRQPNFIKTQCLDSERNTFFFLSSAPDFASNSLDWLLRLSWEFSWLSKKIEENKNTMCTQCLLSHRFFNRVFWGCFLWHLVSIIHLDPTALACLALGVLAVSTDRVRPFFSSTPGLGPPRHTHTHNQGGRLKELARSCRCRGGVRPFGTTPVIPTTPPASGWLSQSKALWF
jgi:hypothetical protein